MLRIQTIFYQIRIRFSKFLILLESDILSKNFRIFRNFYSFQSWYKIFTRRSYLIKIEYCHIKLFSPKKNLLLEDFGMNPMILVDILLVKDPDPVFFPDPDLGCRKVPDLLNMNKLVRTPKRWFIIVACISPGIWKKIGSIVHYDQFFKWLFFWNVHPNIVCEVV